MFFGPKQRDEDKIWREQSGSVNLLAVDGSEGTGEEEEEDSGLQLGTVCAQIGTKCVRRPPPWVEREEAPRSFSQKLGPDSPLWWSCLGSRWVGFTTPPACCLLPCWAVWLLLLLKMFLGDLKGTGLPFVWELSMLPFTYRQATPTLLKTLCEDCGVCSGTFKPCLVDRCSPCPGCSSSPHLCDVTSLASEQKLEELLFFWWMNTINQGSFSIPKGQQQKG